MEHDKRSDLKKKCVEDFVNQIWNQRCFENLSNLVTSNFIDHSQLQRCVKNRKWLRLYLTHLEKYINHHSIIRNMLSFEDLVIARISMQTSLVGEPAETEKMEIFEITRIFKLRNRQIAGYWEIISDLPIS